MNLQLHNVISDITGASGMRILEAILKGKRDPVYLQSLCDKGIKAKAEVIRQSLEGNLSCRVAVHSGPKYSTL